MSKVGRPVHYYPGRARREDQATPKDVEMESRKMKEVE